jgi:hypothetical protein
MMVVDEWHSNGPQDLVTVSLCIQIDLDKIQSCLLSVAYACLYHNPTTGHSAHNIDISKSLAHAMPYMLSAICPVQLKSTLIQRASGHREHLPTEVGYDAKLQSGQDPGGDHKHADELP